MSVVKCNVADVYIIASVAHAVNGFQQNTVAGCFMIFQNIGKQRFGGNKKWMV